MIELSLWKTKKKEVGYMERKISKRKMLRRKYKNYAVALAGAALLTGAGAAIPATTFAAANPVNVDQQRVVAHYDTRVNDKSHYDTRFNDKSRYDTRYSNSNRTSNAGYITRYSNGIRFDTRFGTRYDYRNGWHRHDHSWPGSNENQALYKDGHIYYR
jgi:hypothetical protein